MIFEIGFPLFSLKDWRARESVEDHGLPRYLLASIGLIAPGSSYLVTKRLSDSICSNLQHFNKPCILYLYCGGHMTFLAYHVGMLTRCPRVIVDEGLQGYVAGITEYMGPERYSVLCTWCLSPSIAPISCSKTLRSDDQGPRRQPALQICTTKCRTVHRTPYMYNIR